MARIIETITKPTTDKPCKTAEEMEEVCCKPTAALQCCEKKEPWNGYSAEEVLKKAGISVDDQGFDSQGRFVEVRFTPRTKACGEKVTKYDTTPGKCCDQVEPLVVDDENSAEIIADYSTGMIYVAGGKLPLLVQVSGVGFYVANTSNPNDGFRTAEVFGRAIPIKTLDACGVGIFTISDGCTEVTVKVKSTNGQWAIVEARTGYDAIPGPIYSGLSIMQADSFEHAGVGADWVVEASSGNLKIESILKTSGFEEECSDTSCPGFSCGTLGRCRKLIKLNYFPCFKAEVGSYSYCFYVYSYSISEWVC